VPNQPFSLDSFQSFGDLLKYLRRRERLTQLEREKLTADYQETIKRIEYLRSVLGSEALVRKIIKDELLARVSQGIIPVGAQVFFSFFVALFWLVFVGQGGLLGSTSG